MNDMTEPDQLAGLRVDQVGSLLRPAPLREVVARHRDGQASPEELAAAQDEAIRSVVARQEALGFPVLTDGEFRRVNFQDGFANSVTNFERNPNMADPPPGWRPGQPARISGPMRLTANQALDEWRFAQDLTDTPVKVTVLSPAQAVWRVDAEPRSGYAGHDEVVAAAADVQHAAFALLAGAGCPYVQVDAPSYSDYVDEDRRAAAVAAGGDPLADLGRDLAADNAAIAGITGTTFGVHLCRGNINPRFLRRGGYDPIAEQLFNGLDHHRFLLEYDTDRAGGFEPLRFVPKGKTVVLGLVSTKLGELEDADELKRRIDEAARYVPLDQLAISPQCGFSTAVRFGESATTEEDQWRKLELVRQVAEDVWGAGTAGQPS